MQTKKLTLEYLFKRGGKLAPGDVYEFGGQLTTVTKGHLTLANTPQPNDDERFIKSFAMRENKGVQPCSGYMPVCVEFSEAECDDDKKGSAHGFEWNLNDGCVKSWAHDIEKLTKYQEKESETKMKKLTSDQVDWEIGDVMAIVEVGTNEVLIRYTHAAHIEESCTQYSVMREENNEPVKTVRDAVNRYRGDLPPAGYIVASIGYDAFGWGFSAKVNKDNHVCTTEEFNAEVKAMSEYAWIDGGKWDYELYKKDYAMDEPAKTVRDAISCCYSGSRLLLRDGWYLNQTGAISFNGSQVCTVKEAECEIKSLSYFDGLHSFNDYIEYEDEVLEPEPLVYTQEMKDAGELPKVGMKVVVTGYGYKDDHETTCDVEVLGHYKSETRDGRVYIIAKSFSEAHGVELFDKWSPIETRTPEQIKIQKLSDYICANKDVPVEDLAAGIIDGLCGGDNE